jgi:hypothetical protein
MFAIATLARAITALLTAATGLLVEMRRSRPAPEKRPR